MEKDLSRLPSERVVRIDYEAFCNNPEGLVRKIIFSINATKTKNPTHQFFKISHGYPQNHEEITLICLLEKLDNE